MKINTKIFTLIAGLALVLSGCQDDDFGKKYEPAKVGDKIILGGTSGYAEEGRTQYGEKGNGATPIKWYNGDQVRIYSAEANINGSTDKYSDYAVVEVGSSVSTKLTAINSEASLQWGDASEHTFYGVYPTPGQLEASGDTESNLSSSSLSLVGNKVTGYLPSNQAPKSGQSYVQESNGNYIIHPAMRYAYMVAKNTATINDGAVTLTFRPIVTAVEITVINKSRDIKDGKDGEIFPIKNIQAFSVSSNSVICGNFETTINNITSDDDNSNDFTTKVKSEETSFKTVFIPIFDTKGNPGITELGAEKSVTFTAFMMLEDGQDLSALTVNIHTESGVKSGQIKRDKEGEIIIQAEKKNFLTNIPHNIGVRSESLKGSNWVSHIPVEQEDMPVSSLSIPGAGGAASGTKNTAGAFVIPDTYRQQNLSVTELWNQGVRCFEFAVDRPSSSSTSLAGQAVISGGRETGKTISDAVNEVKSCLLAHPDEFAMVIITYENLGGWKDSYDVQRNPENFMSSLNLFWESLGDDWTPTGTKTHNNTLGTALYDPEKTTVASARGKLFCIARPTSAYHDDKPEVTSTSGNGTIKYTENTSVTNISTKILVINGWGPLKDKWEARGYTANIYHRGRHRGNKDVIAWNTFGNKIGRPFDTSEMTYRSSKQDYDGNEPDPINYYTTAEGANGTGENPDPANFYYDMQIGNTTVKPNAVWAQEWARVSPASATVSGYPSDPVDEKKYRIWYWRPSISEKELRIKQTLEYALNVDNKALSGVKLYINSLCGYFIDNDIEMSYTPLTLTEGSCNLTDLWLTKYWTTGKLSTNSQYAGMEGDIDSYAKYINNYFYNLLVDVKNKGYMDGTNGTGIILMDRVSNDAIGNPAGYYIPQMIWANNFKTNIGL